MKKAFTLIELLVVIAIIAILAAILFPVFAQAKTAAKKTQGLAQMKQIGTALQIYAADYDDGVPTWNTCLATYPTSLRPVVCPTGNFPASAHWDALLQPYVRNGNPELSDYSGLWRSPGATYTTGRSLGINQLVMWDISVREVSGSPAPDDPAQAITTRINNGAFYWLNLGAAETVSETVYVADSGLAGRLDPAWFRNAFRDTYITRNPSWAQPWRYSNEGANYVRLDSSARHERGDRMYPNPGRTQAVFATWPAAWPLNITGNAYCQAARWQAPRADQKEMLVQAAASIGVTCQ